MMKTTSIIGLNLLPLLLLATPSYAAILNDRPILSKDTAWVANNDTCDKKRQSAEYYYDLGKRYIDESGQISCFDKAIKVNPKHFEAYDRRGNAKRTIGNLKGAIIDYNMAIKINPKYGYAYYNRAVAKEESNDIKGAVADYTKALEIFRLDNDDDGLRDRNLESATKALEKLKSKSSVTP
jgi:tetratricopeptide (TPR) repeat protein